MTMWMQHRRCSDDISTQRGFSSGGDVKTIGAGFCHGLDANVDFKSSNDVNKCKDKIRFSREFVNLRIYFT